MQAWDLIHQNGAIGSEKGKIGKYAEFSAIKCHEDLCNVISRSIVNNLIEIESEKANVANFQP